MPIVGENMLIVLPFGFVFCAYVAERLEPYHFRLERAHMIEETHGLKWDMLADNTCDRKQATFRDYGELFVGPEFVWSKKWAGNLPY